MHDPAPNHRPSARTARAFTIIELLLVVAIIGVLVSLVIVSLSGVLRTSNNGLAARQLQTVATAIQQFENDLGYIPPLMVPSEDEQNVVVDPLKQGNSNQVLTELRRNRYMSEYSLVMYLVGAGDIDGDEPSTQRQGVNTDEDDGLAGPGIRNPGPDRSWGGATNRSLQRNSDTATKTGRTYGPYLDPADVSELLALDENTGLFRLVDPWDQPIRYYSGWPTLRPDPNNSSRRIPSVELVPVELRSERGVRTQVENGGTPSDADLELERTALNSRYMLLSAGEPTDFDTSGNPVPQFGETNEQGAEIQGGLSEADWELDLSSATIDEAEYLYSRLRSNIREGR